MGEYCVDGDWGDFEFKTVVKSDYPAVMQHIKSHYCNDEPILTLIGSSTELKNDICHFARTTLEKENGLSFMAIHKPSKKVAGLRITNKANKDEESPPLTPTSKRFANVLYNMRNMSKSANLFERYGVDHYAKLLIASVDPEFRGKGLATEMYRRSLNLLRSRGYPLAYSNFTSPFTRKIATKFGFEEVVRRYFKDFKDANGEKFVHNEGDGEYCALMAISL